MKKSDTSKFYKIPGKLINHLHPDEVQIWDVRTPMEFIHGHITGAENVPFDELDWFIEKAKNCDKIIVTCSADDDRSYLVCQKLSELDVEAVDGGNWQRLKEFINN